MRPVNTNSVCIERAFVLCNRAQGELYLNVEQTCNKCGAVCVNTTMKSLWTMYIVRDIGLWWMHPIIDTRKETKKQRKWWAYTHRRTHMVLCIQTLLYDSCWPEQCKWNLFSWLARKVCGCGGLFSTDHCYGNAESVSLLSLFFIFLFFLFFFL